MLQKNAVENKVLDLIHILLSDPELSEFSLAGGTALALYYGHRKSVDIDLFSLSDFDVRHLLEYLERKYHFALIYQEKNTLKGLISGVFVDMITHAYPLVEKVKTWEGIRLYAIEDLAAMKVNVISGDGTRIKDFIDLYFLLGHFNLKEILSFYTKKYDGRNDFHVVKSLEYFGDLPSNPPWPVMLKEKDLTLEKIKKRITSAVKEMLEG